MVSSSVRAPWAPAAARTAFRSAIRPLDDCTEDRATSAVSGPTASASRSSGAYRILRSPRTAKGLTTELNSPSGTRTSAPGGSAAATSPTCTATELPTATRSASTPESRAKPDRAASTASKSPESARLPEPIASASARTAATVRRGSSPQVEVLR